MVILRKFGGKHLFFLNVNGNIGATDLGKMSVHLIRSLFIITCDFYKKVTQSPIVPRVRGGDPFGVVPGKVDDDISGSGHPRKLIS